MANTSKEKIQSIEQELWGKHGDNGIKGEVKKLDNELEKMKSDQQKMIIDINNIGNSFRQIKKLAWSIIGLIITAGVVNIIGIDKFFE